MSGGYADVDMHGEPVPWLCRLAGHWFRWAHLPASPRYSVFAILRCSRCGADKLGHDGPVRWLEYRDDRL